MLKKVEYVVVNSDGNYFVEISKINKIVFTKDRDEATKLSSDDTDELLPLIKLYSGYVAHAEIV